MFQLLLSVSKKLLFIKCSLLSSVCVCVKHYKFCNIYGGREVLE